MQEVESIKNVIFYAFNFSAIREKNFSLVYLASQENWAGSPEAGQQVLLHKHLQFPVGALAALGHELVHHGDWQPSKWNTDISPSRIWDGFWATAG